MLPVKILSDELPNIQMIINYDFEIKSKISIELYNIKNN